MRDNTNHKRKQNEGKGSRNIFSFEKTYYVAYIFFFD